MFDRAEELLQRVLTVLRSKVGENHWYYALVLCRTGVIRHKAGQAAKAEEIFRRAIELGEKDVGMDSWWLEEPYRRYSQFLREANRAEESREFDKKAERLRRMHSVER